MGHAGERITLLDANGIGHILVSTGERNWLECDGLNFIDVPGCELDDRADAIVIDGVDDRRDQSNFNADTRQVLDRLLLYIEKVADAAMCVLFFAHAVKL